jgi:hypothetical protein
MLGRQAGGRDGSHYGVDDRPAVARRVRLWAGAGRGRGGDRRAPAPVGGATPASPAAAIHTGGSNAARRSGQAPTPGAMAGLLGHPVDVAALASEVGRPPLDLPPDWWPAGSRPGCRRAGATAGSGEPAIGISADRGRVPHPRRARVGVLGETDPAPAPARPSTAPKRPVLDRVPAVPGSRNAGLRLLHRGDRRAVFKGLTLRRTGSGCSSATGTPRSVARSMPCSPRPGSTS